MTNEITYDSEDDEEPVYGPSHALPPLYLLRARARCPVCGDLMHVYTLGCAAFHDAEFAFPIEEFHFLRRTRSVPDSLSLLLRATCPDFHIDREDGDEPPYLMNHCPCGAKLDDDFVAGDIGAPFMPDTPVGYRQIKLFRVPVTIAIPVESSYMIGGGEYMNVKDAEPI